MRSDPPMKQSPANPDHRPSAWQSAAVPEEVYAEIEQALASPDSPVGIDAKHTHVLILYALERIERKIAEVEGPSGALVTDQIDPEAEARVRTEVRKLLAQAPAYAQLERLRRERLADDVSRMLRVAASGLTRSIDFPGFVAEILDGVFEAIVKASIEQMEDYADLLEDATEGLDEFVEDAGGEAAVRNRQRLLATMVLMGVSRIRVSGKGIRVKNTLDCEED